MSEPHLAALLELQRELALEADIDKVIARITAAATAILEADRATLYVVDAARQELWSRVVTQSEFSDSSPSRSIRAARSPRTSSVATLKIGSSRS
ncbi:MAG: hypothetical protein FJ028_02500 [Chloroflexi bacterium]|nr:hypothetical protein [Chloroflexota bacterium]